MHVVLTILLYLSGVTLMFSLIVLLIAVCLIAQTRARALVTAGMLIECPSTSNGLREILTAEFSSQKEEIDRDVQIQGWAFRLALGSAFCCIVLTGFF